MTFSSFRAAVVLLTLAAGCGQSPTHLRRDYATAHANLDSVNGTSVLLELFRQSGHNVRKRSYLSPKANRSDVIVWAPDNFNTPDKEKLEFWDRWLSEKEGRTLIYIGRDYDAEPRYWDYALQKAPPQQVKEILRRRALARSDHAQQRAHAKPGQEFLGSIWAPQERKRVLTDPAQLGGEWLEVLELPPDQEMEIELHSRVKPSQQAKTRGAVRPLLTAGEDMLVMEARLHKWGSSRVVYVANGSFLFNLPLVNHQHRRLASQLVSDCGENREVLILSEKSGELSIYSSEPGQDAATGLEVLTTWPVNVILMHFFVCGIIYLLAYCPTVGRPRELPDTGKTDFRRHIQALGEWMARSGDYSRARTLLKHYQSQNSSDSK